MDGRSFHPLQSTIGILRHPCDLDLLLFFQSHPRSLLTGEQLAAHVGYELNQVGRSLDLLVEAEVLTRSEGPTHGACLYVLQAPDHGWLASLIDLAATREGRQRLLDTIKAASTAEAADDPSSAPDPAAHPGRRANIS
jgi:hypothetical protein